MSVLRSSRSRKWARDDRCHGCRCPSMSLWLHLGPNLSVSAALSPPPPGPPAGAAWRSDAIRLRGDWVPPGGLQVTLTSAVPSAAAAPPPPARTFNVSLLKSALQKAVRRSLAGTAVRLAHQLMAQDVQAFLRRIPVIMLEDSLLSRRSASRSTARRPAVRPRCRAPSPHGAASAARASAARPGGAGTGRPRSDGAWMRRGREGGGVRLQGLRPVPQRRPGAV